MDSTTLAELRPEPMLSFELPHGMTIAADAYGNASDPAVLFMHGGGQTRHAWGGTAEALSQIGFYAICMDMRGHGDSSWAADGRYRVDDYVEDLLGVVEQLGRAPILVGASLGGIAGLLAAARSGSSVARGLVLVDVTPRTRRDGIERIIGFMKAGAEGFASLEEAAEAIASYLPQRKRRSDLTGLAKNLRQDEKGRFQWHWDPKILEVWDPSRYDQQTRTQIVEDRLVAARQLTVPTLLIRGRMSDVVSEEAAQEFLGLAPHAEYVDLAGAAHMVAGDRNDAFTEAVTSFIKKHFENLD